MSNNTLKITIVVDNEAQEGLEKEHGFAAWIEAGSRRILFDTGHEGALQENAKRLGIDLGEADVLVISHGHKDHTGTLDRFLAVNGKAELYFANGIGSRRYSYNPEPREFSMPSACRQALETLPAGRVHPLMTPQYLAPGIGITGPVARLTTFEDTGGTFYLDPDRRDVDLIDDDQSMWFETNGGLVVLVGCCHSGLSNTIASIRAVSGMDKVCGVVGGMHLLHASEERLEKTFNIMRGWNANFLIPCHCTGMTPATKMMDAIGSDVVKLGYAGMVVEAGTLC